MCRNAYTAIQQEHNSVNGIDDDAHKSSSTAKLWKQMRAAYTGVTKRAFGGSKG